MHHMETHMQLDLDNKPIAAKALAIATKHHEGIERKYTGEPYITHPIEVAEILLKYGIADQEVLAAALLHDCLEDRNAKGEYLLEITIKSHCGARVLRWVNLLTNREKGNRATRKAAAAKRIAGAPWQVQAIKLADIMHNCEGIALLDPNFASTYIEEKRTLVRGLPPHRSTERLANDAYGILSNEMNQIAVLRLEAGREQERIMKVEMAEVRQIVASESINPYAEMAMF